MTLNQSTNAPRFGLNRAEAALFIGVSPNSFNKMIEEGIMPTPRLWHSRLFWLRDELESSLRDLPQEIDETPLKWRA